MSQEEGWRVATGPTEWVTVKTADEALRLGAKFAELTADLGVYKAECDRLQGALDRACDTQTDDIERLLREDCDRLKAERDRLAAEVEHLKTKPTLADQYATYAALAAENERLRKAGDAMYGYITNVILDGRISSPYLNKLQDDWDNAAKEGRDAK